MKELATRLSEAGYPQFYLFFGEMNLRYRDWAAAAEALPKGLVPWVRLFLLGQAMPTKGASRLVGQANLSRLLEAGILLAEGDAIRSNSFYLVVFRGMFYFCQMGPDPFAYVGEDSLALGQYQSPVRGSRVLDLCAGPGIQSMVASLRGNQVVAVERNPRACLVHRINLELNGLEDRVEVVADSVERFAERAEGEFDRIVFNPPLVPMPASREGFPAAGYGGADGLDLTREILSRYRRRLTREGAFEFVGMTLCPRRTQHHPIAQIARRSRLCGRVHILSRHRITGNAVVAGMHAATLGKAKGTSAQVAATRLESGYRGSDHFFLFFASLRPTRKGTRAGLETVDMSASHYGGWFS